MQQNGFIAPSDPVLEPFENIQNMDAKKALARALNWVYTHVHILDVNGFTNFKGMNQYGWACASMR